MYPFSQTFATKSSRTSLAEKEPRYHPPHHQSQSILATTPYSNAPRQPKDSTSHQTPRFSALFLPSPSTPPSSRLSLLPPSGTNPYIKQPFFQLLQTSLIPNLTLPFPLPPCPALPIHASTCHSYQTLRSSVWRHIWTVNAASSGTYRGAYSISLSSELPPHKPLHTPQPHEQSFKSDG